MKKLLFALTGIMIALVLVFAIGGMLLPKSKQMTPRTILIDAPAETVFAQVNDLRNWSAWSYWQSMDPQMKVTYGETAEGAGGSYTWDGEKAGTGELRIVASEAFTHIETALDFGKMGKGDGHWNFTDTGEGIEVSWGFTSHAPNLLGRWFNLVLDGMLASSFDQGLAKIKAIAEAAPPPAAPVNPCANPCGGANPCGSE